MNPSPSKWARVKSLFLRATEASHPSEVLDAEPGAAAESVRRMLGVAPGFISNLHVEESTATSETHLNLHWLFAPGTLVASRFEIVQPLGRGGMGEIYESFDRVKNVSVALKIVLPNPAIDPQIAERLLRREFSLAQMVSHRNICRIHDPYVHDPGSGPPILVISMELLRGKTLAAMLVEQGRLDGANVAAIARQLAAGIDAAHAAGVVHRDLKPSNVIVVDEQGGPRIVITDFGLARQVAVQTVTQVSGAVAGTLRYMAPEQIEGRADKRSDLYTFAFILFELLTGELPFIGGSDLSVALNRLFVPPRDPATVTPGISIAWRTALLRGLSRVPERRFRSAGDLIRAIEAPTTPVLLWPRLLGIRFRAAPRLTRWATLTAVVSAGALVALLLKPDPGTFPGFSRVLIADLRHSETQDAALLGADTSLAAAVAQSPHLIAVRPSELASTLAKMGKPADFSLDEETVRQLAMRTGESVVLWGSIAKKGGYTLRLRLDQMGNSPRRPAASIEQEFRAADEKGLFGAISSAANWVRRLSGEGARELNEQNARPEDLTTGSWEAMRLLQKARARRAANDPQGALLFAKEALDLDPDFAAAQSFSADTHTDLRQYKQAFTGYERAVQLVKRRNVTGRERYQIEAAYNVDSGDVKQSLATYEAWITHFPQDYLAHFYFGYSLFHQGDYPKALAEMERARRSAPTDFFILPHLAMAYLANEQLQQAQECADQLRELGESDWALEVEGLMLLARHRFEEAAQKVTPLTSRPDVVFSAIAPHYVATALADAGRLRDAEQELTHTADMEIGTSSRGRFTDRQLEIAYLRWVQGDSTGAHRTLAPVSADLDNPDSLSLAGALFARVGDLRSAESVLRALDRWPSVPLVSKASTRIRAEIALATHAAGAHTTVVRGATPAPLDLEQLLYAARMAGNNDAIERIRQEIRERKDILLSWDRQTPGQGPIGLYWLASCTTGCLAR